MAETQYYGFEKLNPTDPVYPYVIDNINQALDEIDEEIKNTNDNIESVAEQLDNKIDKDIVTNKGDILIGIDDATVGRLPIGTQGQILTSALVGGEVTLKWDNLVALIGAILTTKGDILIASNANTVTRLGIGSEGQVLMTGNDGLPEWSTLPEPPEPEIPEIPEQMVLTGEELPEASSEYRGKIFTVLSGENQEDTTYICLKQSDENYTWKELNFTNE